MARDGGQGRKRAQKVVFAGPAMMTGQEDVVQLRVNGGMLVMRMAKL